MEIIKQKCPCGCGKLMKQSYCNYCKKEFIPLHSSKGIYCGIKCSANARKGSNNPAWKGGKIQRTCKQCSLNFDIFPSELKKNSNGGQFCSKSCRATYINKIRVKNDTHNFTNNGYNLGIPLSIETKEKLSKVMKEKYTKNQNPFKGQKHTEETKLKMKESKKKLFDSGYVHLKTNLTHEAKDGTYLRSIHEVSVFNWLLDNNLEFKYEPRVKNSSLIADFKCKNFFIEVWSKKWRINEPRNKEKIQFYKKNNISLINVFPPDLSPLYILLGN